MQQSFILPPNGQLSPDAVSRRRLMAQAMMGQGMDSSPVGHPLQGVARVAQALAGGYGMRKADQAEQEGRAQFNTRIASALQGEPDMGQLAELSGDPYGQDNPLVAQMIAQRFKENQPKEPFKLSKGERLIQKNDDGTYQPIDMGEGTTEPVDFGEQLQLTNQVLKGAGVERFNETIPLIRSMAESINDNRTAHDMDFVYGASLTLSPDGRVTDQDAKNLSGNASIRQRIVGEINAMLKGEGKLTATSRRALYDLALRRVSKYREQAGEELGFYKKIMPPGMQTPELGTMPPELPPLQDAPLPQEGNAGGHPDFAATGGAPQPRRRVTRNGVVVEF
jgi:hypothetical protein